MTDLHDLTLSDLAQLADLFRHAAEQVEATGKQRAAPAVAPATRKRSKALPEQGVDIQTLDGLTDREAVKQLGGATGAGSYYTGVIRQARKRAARPPSYPVCEAAVKMRLGLRCDLAAIPGEPWCRSHHPDPPPAEPPAPSARALARRAEYELTWRPDGHVLRALQTQTDVFYELVTELRWHRDHVQHLEQLKGSEGKVPAWMTVSQAAEYAGRPVSSLRQALLTGNLKGSRPRATRSWSLRAVDIDAWLSQETAGPPPGRRRRST